ncbi:MAG TPA: UvrD-helicase domain-containing protein [Nocardioidaceae bacterium]|nr:UvrD-helicase domain-containing protein [Nocardioidaceae bacterium]
MAQVRFIADLHIHSKYSMACSKDCDLEHLTWWARRKGVTLVGTGDFTHPKWYEHLRESLVAAEPGLFRLRDDLDRDVRRTQPANLADRDVRFMLSVEISTIYKRADRTRKVHHLVYMPDLDAAAEFNRRLGRVGNLGSDGRPILGLDSRDLLEITLESGDGSYLVPAHLWTPWFAVLGSKSGFDAVEACYADLADHIFAVETGLSSDPSMNWRLSALDRYRLVSNSDAHSPPMLGREATIFDTDLDYRSVRRSMETGVGLAGTIEFFPEEGKYHTDGHRTCGVRLDPPETRAHGGLCPECGKPLTVGVLNRVEELADRPAGFRPDGAPEVHSLVQLPLIMSELLGVGPKSKRVLREIETLTTALGPELAILQDVPVDDIKGHSPLLAEAIDRLRRGEVIRESGYDGEYGVILLFEPGELARLDETVAPALFEGFEAAVPAEAPPLGRDDPSIVARRSAAPSPKTRSQSADRRQTTDGSSLLAEVSLLDGLDPDQRAAAGAADGPLLIVAGPGTGKTRTLTHRLAHLVTACDVAPETCLAITFTRRAAAELTERLEALAPEAAPAITVATFHSFGLRILREQHERAGLPRDFRIVDRTADDIADPESDMVGFDDLVALPVGLLESDPELAAAYRERFRWICVDEYQDVDDTQYRLLRQLAPPDGNITAIGDPDQAIYRFRGADVGFFLRFREDFPEARTVQLTRNYRSSAPIVSAARQAIAPTTLVPDRELRPVGDHGDALVGVHHSASERAEAAFVARTVEQVIGGASLYAFDSGRVDSDGTQGLSFSDFTVLYRTDRQSGAVMNALTHAGLPFQKRSHDRLLDRPGVRRLLDELGFVPTDGIASTSVGDRLRRATDTVLDRTPAAEREEAAVETYAALDLLAPLADRCADDLDRFRSELALGVEVDTWDPRADRISLLTLHAAKGLEFPVVFIVGCEDGLLPLRWSGAPDGVDEDHVREERRLLFVGMTRAQRHLYLSHAAERVVRGAIRKPRRTPFLDGLDAAVWERIGDAAPRQMARATQLRLL